MPIDLLKQILLGSFVGRTALAFRARLERAMAHADFLPTVLNDQLAGTLVCALCRPGMTFIDVGAHIGSVIAGVRAHDPSVRIVAIEAMPDKVDRLRRKFPEITLHCCAAGQEPGIVAFFVDDERSGYSSLANVGGRRIEVQQMPLDELVLDTFVDVMKIDVEGAELGVLIGADALVGRCRPTIMFESGPEEKLGYTKQRLFDWFSAREYLLFVPNRLRHTGPALSREVFLDSHHYPRRTTNYFAVASERRHEIRERANTIQSFVAHQR